MLVESHDEVDLVDIAGLIRQLLFDKRALVDVVSDGHSLSFEVGVFGITSDDDPFRDMLIYAALNDAIDPDTAPPHKTRVSLTRNQFGQHRVAISRGEWITIKDIVKFNANRKGGRHYDPEPHPEFKKLQVLEGIYFGGIAAGTREMKAIGRVVLRALDPLVKRLQSPDV